MSKKTSTAMFENFYLVDICPGRKIEECYSEIEKMIKTAAKSRHRKIAVDITKAMPPEDNDLKSIISMYLESNKRYVRLSIIDPRNLQIIMGSVLENLIDVYPKLDNYHKAVMFERQSTAN